MQVELAQLDYCITEIARPWQKSSRLGGGIGTRGPGEREVRDGS
ncbi:hypothetical protein UM582_12650 [Staphylococcus aureus]|nr:hypothetical protein UM582_12650 [Staphylococcus aureus]